MAGDVQKRKKAPSQSQSQSSHADAGDKLSEGHHWGFTGAGEKFQVPDTLNTVSTLLPHNLSIGSALTLLCILTSAYLVFFGQLTKWPHICIFFFFRCGYDIGLGLILRAQSEHKWFFKNYVTLYNKGGAFRRLLNHLAESQLHRDVRKHKKIDEYPAEFRAWLVYKNLVNLILINDGISYLLLGLKCFHIPAWQDVDYLVIGQYLLGVFLCVFNYWAKVDAHRCIGEYCWYWGDFFFRKDLNLTFDGIFELFPHPMYTVGYSSYYGYSLISRSYTMLFVSLIAHMMQLSFLVLVEEPHIERTYGGPPKIDQEKMRVLYDPSSGLFPSQKDPIFLWKFDIFRSGDWATLLTVVYGLLVAFLPENDNFAVGQVIFWRVFHWLGLGAMLWAQSNYQLWTRHFTKRGRSTLEAFNHWKTTYNMSLTMNIVVFVACAVRFILNTWTVEHLMQAKFVAFLALGFVLILLSIWTVYSTFTAVGEFGWYYGDFFFSANSFKNNLCYTGIYRFLNNPDCVTGYAGQYGLALISQNWTIFLLAVFSHVLNIIFLNLVEIPHMNKLYSKKEIRTQAPFPKVLKKVGDAVLPEKVKEKQNTLEQNVRKELRQIRMKTLSEVYGIYKKLADKKAASASTSSSDSYNVKLNVPAKTTIGESLEITYEATAAPHESDWVGIYPVGVNSVPSASEGRWLYVPTALKGKIEFPAALLPHEEGVYEIRWHMRNQYVVKAKQPIIIESTNSNSSEDEDEDDN